GKTTLGALTTAAPAGIIRGVSGTSVAVSRNIVMNVSPVALAVVLCLPLTAAAQAPAQPPPKLPRTFTGVFEWRGGGPARERVELVIDKVEEKDGVITFVGTQTYQNAG